MVISDFNIICLAQKGAELFNSKMIKSTANNLNVISVDHAISPDLPKCRSNNENYYYKNGLIVENKSDLRGIIYKRIQNGINTVEFKLCGNVFENETEIMYFVQKSVEVATHLSKSFSVAYTANPQQNIYFFLWTFK